MRSPRPDIFEFLDFRLFLAEYYRLAKEQLPHFSYRWFSKRAGFASPNFLKLVIDGDRNLSADSTERVATAVGLTAAEANFFAHLVALGQGATSEEKNAAWERIAATRRFKRARRLESDWFDYLSRWYHPAIREMTARPDFREEPAWIASQLIPAISPAQAAEALQKLLQLGLVVRDADGRLVRSDVTMTTGHEVRSLALGNYHRQMLQRAADAIETVPSDQRDMGALTVSIPASLVPELKERLQAFRERLLDLCDGADSPPDVVYQVNLQLFPLTRSRQPDEP